MKKFFVSLLTLCAFTLAYPLHGAPSPDIEMSDTTLATEATEMTDSTAAETSAPLVAEAPKSTSTDVQPIVTDISTTIDDETPYEVGEASKETSQAAKRRIWGNVFLAIAAVAVATTALILVSKNH